MGSTVQDVVEEFRKGADAARLESIPVPATFAATVIRKEDQGVFADDDDDRDPSRTLRLAEVETPELAPDEVLLVVMASSLNFNTAWAATFQPVSTFPILERYGKSGRWASRHDQPFHIPGSEATGFILRRGSMVETWQVGDQACVHATHVDPTDPGTHDDAMKATSQRAWGFETNFGGLAELTVVKAAQLLPRPRHLSWEEAGTTIGCGGSVYRCLVSDAGARMRQGEVVLIWGAAGGMGSFATQLVRNGGGIPVGVVSSEARADVVRRAGCELVINRSDFAMPIDDAGIPGDKEMRAFGREVRRLAGKDPDIVFEHPGRDTMAASVYLGARGARIVTNAATSGPIVAFDNRHLWMKLKSIVGSHVANGKECADFNELVQRGMIVPTVSRTVPLAEVGEATRALSAGEVIGKVAVQCCAALGEGVEDPALREQVGEDRINVYRTA